MKKIKSYLMIVMLVVPIVIAIFLSGCLYNPEIDPADFVLTIDNQYYPLIPGTTFYYQTAGSSDFERNEVYVTHETKIILGVTTTVVHDRVWNETDDLVEETFDWYAQDKDGNVWYFGEDSKTYKNGVVVSTKGSWEAGKNGSKPGIVMKTNPKVGDSYWQEYALGVAMDRAKVLSLTENYSVPYGTFENCLKTEDWTPLEPLIRENKYYALGIGEIAEAAKGGSGRSELINITTE